MANRIWIEPGNWPRQAPGTQPQPVGNGQERRSIGFSVRLERQDGNLITAASQNVEILIGEDAKRALLADHKAFTANEQRIAGEAIKIAVASCMLQGISLDNIFIVRNGDPRRPSTRFEGLHLVQQSAEELFVAPYEIRRRARDGHLYRLSRPPCLDYLLRDFEVSVVGASDPILMDLADRLALVRAIQSGQVTTIFMEVKTIDDSWKRGKIGTHLFGSNGHVDGHIVTVWCQNGPLIVSLGQVAAYHITSSCPSAGDFRICGDEELSGLLHVDPVLKDMFAVLICWIIAHEKDDQDMVIWLSNARFTTDIGRELSEAERKRMPIQVLELESVRTSLRCLDVDERLKLQVRAQQVVTPGKKVSLCFVGSQAIQQCGRRLHVLAELLAELIRMTGAASKVVNPI